jgi:hypothetical protein
MNVEHEIAEIFRQLNDQLTVNDPRAKRDAAHACCEKLETLLSTVDAEQRSLVEQACLRARCTFDALHQDLQETLEWASSASVD